MPVPANVIARRNISVTQGNSTIPDYPGIQNIIFLGTTGKPDLPVYAPPYAPNTPVPAGTKYLDVMDDGTGPLPVATEMLRRAMTFAGTGMMSTYGAHELALCCNAVVAAYFRQAVRSRKVVRYFLRRLDERAIVLGERLLRRSSDGTHFLLRGKYAGWHWGKQLNGHGVVIAMSCASDRAVG